MSTPDLELVPSGDGEFDETEVTLDEPEQPTSYFANAGEWVEKWALPHWRRSDAGHKWDPQWWAYPEALTVLESLWRSWEQMRLEGLTGTAIYMRDYFYPLMQTLTSPEGPFWKVAKFSTTGDERPTDWNSEPVPEGLFDPPVEEE